MHANSFRAEALHDRLINGSEGFVNVIYEIVYTSCFTKHCWLRASATLTKFKISTSLKDVSISYSAHKRCQSGDGTL